MHSHTHWVTPLQTTSLVGHTTPHHDFEPGHQQRPHSHGFGVKEEPSDLGHYLAVKNGNLINQNKGLGPQQKSDKSNIKYITLKKKSPHGILFFSLKKKKQQKISTKDTMVLC